MLNFTYPIKDAKFIPEFNINTTGPPDHEFWCSRPENWTGLIQNVYEDWDDRRRLQLQSSEEASIGESIEDKVEDAKSNPMKVIIPEPEYDYTTDDIEFDLGLRYLRINF